MKADKDQDRQAEVLPEYWPEAPRPEPARAWWIPWPVAVLLAPLFWILPKRMGPHFAAVRWPGVIAAHLCWVVFAIGSITIGVERPRFGWVAYVSGQMPGSETGDQWAALTSSEVFRAPLAMLATVVFDSVEGTEDLLSGFAAATGVVSGLLLIALLFTPFAAAGESFGRLFGRSLKLTLWATTSMLVLGLAFEMIGLADLDYLDSDPWYGAAIGVYPIWFLWIWLRSALRYGGPSEGPGWEKRRPRCGRCGYTLTGLTASDRCPECSATVADALPDHRSSPTVVAGRGVGRRVHAHLGTMRRVLLDRAFFKHLAIHAREGSGRSFALWNCFTATLVGFTVFGGVLAVLMGPSRALEYLELDRRSGQTGFPSLVTIVVWGVLMMPSLLALGLAVLARRTVYEARSVAFHFSPWIIPLTACCGMAVAGLLGMWTVSVGQGAWVGSATQIPGILFFVTPVVAVVFVGLAAVSCLARAVRDTRYANA